MKTDVEVMAEAIDALSDDKAWNKGSWCAIGPEGITHCAEGALLDAVTQGRFTEASKKAFEQLLEGVTEASKKRMTASYDTAEIDLSLEEEQQYDRLVDGLARVYAETIEVENWVGTDGEQIGGWDDDFSPRVYHYNDVRTTSREDIVLGMKILKEKLANE